MKMKKEEEEEAVDKEEEDDDDDDEEEDDEEGAAEEWGERGNEGAVRVRPRGQEQLIHLEKETNEK